MSDFEWIPVTERLPEDTLAKLVTTKIDFPVNKGFATDVANYIDGKWYFSRSRIEVCLEITAWMPLPEPYKAESNEAKCDFNYCCCSDAEARAKSETKPGKPKQERKEKSNEQSCIDGPVNEGS